MVCTVMSYKIQTCRSQLYPLGFKLANCFSIFTVIFIIFYTFYLFETSLYFYMLVLFSKLLFCRAVTAAMASGSSVMFLYEFQCLNRGKPSARFCRHISTAHHSFCILTPLSIRGCFCLFCFVLSMNAGVFLELTDTVQSIISIYSIYFFNFNLHRFDFSYYHYESCYLHFGCTECIFLKCPFFCSK